MGRRRESMAQIELRDESLRKNRNEHDECRKLYGRVEQRSNDRSEEGQECAVVLRPDHAMHGKSSGSHRKCTAWLGHGGVATSLSGVFTEEHCKTCCGEFEMYANIEMPEFLKIGIVIRQAEEGPMRTHVIMNSHRFGNLSAVIARSGDAMDVDAFAKGSKGASKGSGKKQDSVVVCWYCEKKGHRASECRKKQKDNDSGKSKGCKTGDSKGKSNKKEFKGKCYKCGKIGHMSKDCRSKDTGAFEAGDELAEDASKWQASI